MDLYTGGCGVIVYNEDHTKILLGNRTDDQGWCLCGGKREGNETSIETAIRESKEEFGIDILESDIVYEGKIYAKTFIKVKYCNVISNIFSTDKFTGDIVPQQEEMSEIRWCNFDDILNLDKIFIPSLVSINRFVYPIWEKNI